MAATDMSLRDRLIAALPGYMVLLGGVILLGAALLAPQAIELRQTAKQLELMRQQATAMRQQTDRYAKFALALELGDPALMQNLAMAQLGLQPAESTVIWSTEPAAANHSGHPYVATSHTAADVTTPSQAVANRSLANLDEWLSQPIPTLSRTALDDALEPRTRLERITAGNGKLMLIAAAGLLLIAGLIACGDGQPKRAIARA